MKPLKKAVPKKRRRKPTLKSLQMTTKRLRSAGLRYEKVENRWNPFSKKRKDFFNIIDIICLKPKRECLGIQSCTGSPLSHYRKITGVYKRDAALWLRTPGNTLEIWSWTKVLLKRGGTKKIWKERIIKITLSDLRKPKY